MLMDTHESKKSLGPPLLELCTSHKPRGPSPSLLWAQTSAPISPDLCCPPPDPRRKAAGGFPCPPLLFSPSARVLNYKPACGCSAGEPSCSTPRRLRARRWQPPATNVRGRTGDTASRKWEMPWAVGRGGDEDAAFPFGTTPPVQNWLLSLEIWKWGAVFPFPGLSWVPWKSQEMCRGSSEGGRRRSLASSRRRGLLRCS